MLASILLIMSVVSLTKVDCCEAIGHEIVTEWMDIGRRLIGSSTYRSSVER